MADQARYAYAVTRGLEPGRLEGARGIRGMPLQVVSARGLDAVVGDVPLSDFSEEALTRNLESLSWLEEVARSHDEVVRAVSAHGPTAPLRLATIFHDDEAVRTRLVEWHDDIVRVLDRVDGRAEWSVKVIGPEEDRPSAAPPDEVTTGTEFLRRRKAAAEQREKRAVDAGRVADEVHSALAQVSVATRVLPPQDPQLTGLKGAMSLNGAYLVDLAEQERFEAVLDEVRSRFAEVRLESAGPWPPYSFAVLEQS